MDLVSQQEGVLCPGGRLLDAEVRPGDAHRPGPGPAGGRCWPPLTSRALPCPESGLTEKAPARAQDKEGCRRGDV